eukprot:TRINITY_DN4184_c0_g1_i4.p1 TRINITY_DN4184_c0_g1~~TRINITY_DN4184_c0_g1_i4.p1  ORF type:complete len:128 (-),score=53.51 TRINITY_DN4184_c0_g1_i4:16-399(-)
MTTRVFSNISNLPIVQAEGKRMTRGATRKVLGELPVHNQQKTQNILPGVGKENVVDNMCKGQKKVRQTKVAARRLNLVEQEEVPMEVEQVEELAISRVLPIGVKDIDADDASNPQLCSEYALEPLHT